MEALLPYLLPIVVLFASLFLISRAKSRYTGNSKLPPGTTGWPVVGESMKFALLGPEKYINGRMTTCSPEVFQTSLLGEKMAVFCGPAGNKFLFSNENKLLTSWLPLSMRKTLLFPSFVEKSKENQGSLTRSFRHEILKPEALKHYSPVMDSMAKSHIREKWSPNSEVKVFPLTKKYTFDLACHLFLNIDDPEHIKRLYDAFHSVIPGIFSMPIDLPGTAYHRAIKGGRIIRNELLSIIRQREKQLSENKDFGSKYKDLMSQMILAVDEENDKLMNEMEISNNIIGLLVASYETISSSLAMVLNYLAELPLIYQEVLRGLRRRKPGSPEDIQSLITPPTIGVAAGIRVCGVFMVVLGWLEYFRISILVVLLAALKNNGQFDWVAIEVVQGQNPTSKGCRSHEDESIDGDTVKLCGRNSADGRFEDRRKAAQDERRFC
ncbi:hypothetical protein Vadar_031134 [Vaccinium darrowii]|uniref:Uncharacterized protein n=1 Tax=Vaccinium darrowii TaxID=229202 RepID=A0ACB7X5K8_9ERIC|nr:hypothetical protein Vadar_031134 [Vaccinium darrowii]